MRVGDAFVFDGTYRVQSRRGGGPSRLAGRWAASEADELDSRAVNRSLEAHPYWAGQARVEVRAAFVSERAGVFADEPDILYKRSHFDPAPGSPALPSEIVDVRKATANWAERAQLLEALIGPAAHAQACALLGSLERVVADEYAVHEAGHCLGYDTERKSRDGYFRVRDATAWPLVYVDEFRADLLAYGVAADLLAPPDAAAVFVYNVLLRFGVHLQGVAQGAGAPYGSIPLMLFDLLRELGWATPSASSAGPPLALASLAPADVVAVMRECARHATEHLLVPEQAAATATDIALAAARYHRDRTGDEALAAEFDGIFAAAARPVPV